MAKSSIHFERGFRGYFFHNDRTDKTVNSIFKDEENYTNISALKSVQLFDKILNERKEKYIERTGQNVQKKTQTHISAIVNFEKHHTNEDMEKIVKLLENKFDTKVIQYSMHRDEGHIGDNGEMVKNYHCHMEMVGLDTEGNSIRKKFTKSSLSNLQTEIAKTLEMERGINYIKEEVKRPKRLNTYEYKRMKQENDDNERKLNYINMKLKDIKELSKEIREELKLRGGADRGDYKLIEDTLKDLKQLIKGKILTIEQLTDKIDILNKELRITYSSEYVDNLLMEQQKDYITKKEANDRLSKIYNKHKEEKEELNTEIKKLREENKELKKEKLELQNTELEVFDFGKNKPEAEKKPQSNRNNRR